MMMCWNPSFSASAMRCSIRLTGRTSPLSPTSPRHTPPLLYRAYPHCCSIRRLSHSGPSPGSVTRSPPAMFRNTSFCHQFEAHSLLHHSQEHVQPSLVEPRCRALWCAVCRGDHQSLRLDQERADTLDGTADCHSRQSVMIVGKQAAPKDCSPVGVHPAASRRYLTLRYFRIGF